MNGAPRPSLARRGLATSEIVLIAGALVGTGVATAVVAPRVLSAGSDGVPEAIAPEDPALRVVYDDLHELFTSSGAWLAEWGGGDRGGLCAMLWYSDETPNSEIDEHEVVLLWHSSVTESLSGFVADAPDAPIGARSLALHELSSGFFPDRWIGRPDVSGRVLAGGVSNIRIERVSESDGVATLRVHLTWAGARADDRISDSSFEVELAVLQGLE